MSFTPEALRARGFIEQPDGSFTKGAQVVQRPPVYGVGDSHSWRKDSPFVDPPRQPVADENERQSTEERLNKTEKRFLAKLRSGDWNYIGIQEITLRLGFDLRYTPDFHTRHSSGEITFWEIKGGFEREDAIVKLKTAAAKFPYWRFVKAVWKNGQWTETVIRT